MALIMKEADVSTLSQIMLYMQMRNEGKVLNAAEHRIEFDDRKLEEWAKRHNVEKESELLEDENKNAAEGFAKAKRLFLNDFICVKKIAHLIHETERQDDEVITSLKGAIREVKNPVSVETLKRQLNRLEREEKKFDKELRAWHLSDLLQRARMLVNGLYHACEGKFDAALLIRAKTFFNNYFLTYFRLRWESRKLRSDLTKAAKFEDDLDKTHRETVLYLKDRNHLVAQVTRSNKRGSELETHVKQEVDRIVNDQEKVLGFLADAFANALMLMTNSGLLVTKIIYILQGQEHKDIVLVEGFEIPRMIGEKDIQNKKAILRSFEITLHEINVSMNQLAAELN
ncbi:hypothetical protein J4206_05245 [Candidatus Woesearchaeota archaeon]|nr:hypothetical protein [Candidatus Woesearchaeota archaeon]